MVRKFLGCFLVIIASLYTAEAQTPKEKWIDSVFTTMSITDKIGQLFIMNVSTLEDPSNDFENRTKAGAYGGILFKKGKTLRQANLTNRLQSLAKTPLLIGVEGSSGLNLDSALTFPSPLAQGAIANDSLIYFMGKEVGRQMRLLGIHINFISANTSRELNTSSYGENRFLVASKSLLYSSALQSQGILTCAKYFPLQGVSNPHAQKGAPSIRLSVDSLQAYPFKALIRNQLPALMTSSTDLPLFYTTKKSAIRHLLSGKALSAAFAGDWIRQAMKYAGVIFIDIDSLVKSSNKFNPGDAELFAFQSGNDMLVPSSSVGPAIRKMKKFFRKKKDYISQLDRSVKKILALKYDAGLSKQLPINPSAVLPNLITPEARILRQKIYHSAITVASNQQNFLPIRALEDKKFVCVIADDSISGKIFSSRLNKYVQTTAINIHEKSKPLDLTDSLRPKQVIIAALFPETKAETLLKLLPVLKEVNPDREVVIADFGSALFTPYAKDFANVITAYSNESEMLKGVPEVIFGGIPSEGNLPIAFGQIPQGTGISTAELQRLTYSFPEDASMDSRTLDKIESIANEAISMGATPGCHVLVAREGKVVYEKSFGYLTYEKQDPVTDQTIYDLASVTKVSATLQAAMFMFEKGLIDVNKKASVYLPELKNSNKRDFIIKDILTHQAGLWPFLPFWAQTMKDSVHLPEYYSDTLSANYPFVVADKLYASRAMKDSLWGWIVKAKIREKPQRTPFDYRYSDMGFYIMQHVAEKMLNQPMEDFLSQNLYEPLGATTTGYLPLLKFPIHQIAPTENDKLFRKALLIGTVHDQGAAMHGGVAGHAGLFSNANDLAKLGQMLLQEGRYGGIQYYSPQTLHFFTQKQFENSRRGLGWDKPTPGDSNGPTSYFASPKTFGHTGFTGTCIWVDPEFKLVYIFLSNRVHPDMTNNKLLNANIRSRIQDVIYQSIFNYCKTAGGQPERPANLKIEALGRSK